MNINKLYKEFKKEHPETIGETDKTFDQDNYKDWLEIQVMKLRDTQRVNDANTSNEKCTLHNNVSISADEIMKVAVDKASNNNYTWNFDYGVDMANWMLDKFTKH